MMKKNIVFTILFVLVFLNFGFAQDEGAGTEVRAVTEEEVSSTDSVDVDMEEDDNYSNIYIGNEREFNSWSAALYLGSAYSHSSLYTSLQGYKSSYFNFNGEIEVSKQLSHAIALLGYVGKGEIKSYAPSSISLIDYVETDYTTYGLGLDVELTNIAARSDALKYQRRWGWHGYVGGGFIDFTVEDDKGNSLSPVREKKGMTLNSAYIWFGTGVQYRINDSFDVAFRAKYNFTFDDDFDGFALSDNVKSTGDIGDNFFQFNLGLIYKIGKHEKHLKWFSPSSFAPVVEEKEVEEKGVDLTDTDGDGVIDLFDKEPDTPKGARVYGDGVAMDVDGDGVPDYKDKCVNTPGSVELEGCPAKTDKDGDGILDENDDCPNTPGVASKAGCPDMDDIMSRLNYLAKRIYFDTNKYAIKPKSDIVLTEITQVMQEIPAEYTFLIEGHTDSVGKDSSNMTLSANRANSVKEYLISKGVEPSRLASEGFGESRPIADNNTSGGRQLNRRVEISLSNTGGYRVE